MMSTKTGIAESKVDNPGTYRTQGRGPFVFGPLVLSKKEKPRNR